MRVDLGDHELPLAVVAGVLVEGLRVDGLAARTGTRRRTRGLRLVGPGRLRQIEALELDAAKRKLQGLGQSVGVYGTQRLAAALADGPKQPNALKPDRWHGSGRFR